jgi:hypothetical protein
MRFRRAERVRRRNGFERACITGGERIDGCSVPPQSALR